ncbi:histidine--tRNA ligase [Mycoplasmoides alvi]|uniref:histidine--tRNA ligase n=1 Tax=Mycoplasmoides alvi TaxID=78580 RepID=UPI00051AB4DE|nr:histidine--tRNA ligase [Mycoplasmoides alvi]
MKISRPRGTKDLFGLEIDKYNFVIDTCKQLAQNYGFFEIILPTFEYNELFYRNNENSDIVKKELYEFKDRGDRLLALRPEATASLIRCLGENKLLHNWPLPVKVFTYGSMFRYERPQDGRQREFQQFDIEIIGNDSIYDVVNVISYGHKILSKLNLLKNVELRINFIGSFETRSKWIKELKMYFNKYQNELSELSQERLKTNPLRILDDKIDGKLPFVIDAPKIFDFLTNEEKEKFYETLKVLDLLEINYKVTDNLVRGLDYYTDIVFEFVDLTDNLTIIGGGQYDKLVEELTGENLKAIGLAVGVNRCANMIDDSIVNEIINANNKKILLIGLDSMFSKDLIKLSDNLLKENCPLIYNHKINDIKKGIKFCERLGYRYLGIIGLNEMKAKSINIKDLLTQNQIEIDQSKIKNWWMDLK